LSCTLLASPNRGMQTGNAIFSSLASMFSLIAVGVFMGVYYKDINDASSGDDDTYAYDDGSSSLDLKWGPGAVLALVGMLLMWIVTIFQVAAIFTSAAAPMSNQA
jgi:hypothetical protein